MTERAGGGGGGARSDRVARLRRKTTVDMLKWASISRAEEELARDEREAKAEDEDGEDQ